MSSDTQSLNNSRESGVARRTFLKRTSYAAIAFSVVDLIPIAASGKADLDKLDPVCKKYYSTDQACETQDHDSHCKPRAALGETYDADAACALMDSDEACGSPVTNDYWDKDAHCDGNQNNDSSFGKKTIGPTTPVHK